MSPIEPREGGQAREPREPRARRSAVALARLQPLVIGIDVGGTKVLAAEVDADGRVQAVARRSTPGRRVATEELELALTEAVVEVAAGREVDAVGLSAAGFVDASGERVVFAPHLPWRGEHVRRRLAERWQSVVVLDNDANGAALAESRLGAARGADSAVVVTLGTGIGGALVIGGQLWRGHSGMAGEFGHTQVVPQGRECECGGRGCWEQYCSGNQLARLARADLGSQRSLLDDLCGGRAEAITGPMVTEAAAAGDPIALAAFASVGDWLGVGLANLVATFDPQVVVVGGGVAAAGDLLLEPARIALSRELVGAEHRVVPPILRARFGAEAGAVGGAQLARDALERAARSGRRERRRAYKRAPSSQGSSGVRGRWATR